MMITNTYSFNKDLFIDTPPPFDDDRFELWKSRFESFIKAIGFEMLDILINVLFIPTFSFKDEVLNKLFFIGPKKISEKCDIVLK